MRIIRTEMYFDPGEIERSAHLMPLKVAGIAFGWVKSDEDVRKLTEGLDIHRIDPSSVSIVIDLILRRQRIGERLIEGRAINATAFNPQVIRYVESQPILIEQSPPDWTTLKELIGSGLSKGSTSALAIFICVSADPMMFIKLPAAFLVVSLTKTLSKWIEKNVPKLIDQASKKMLR
jgi:hypothetical protein